MIIEFRNLWLFAGFVAVAVSSVAVGLVVSDLGCNGVGVVGLVAGFESVDISSGDELRTFLIASILRPIGFCKVALRYIA